jgi:putative membrane protein
MMGYGYGMMGGYGVVSLLLIGLVIYAVVKLAQGGHENNNTRNPGNNALNILNQRYASGEISEEEYKQKKKMLRY